MGRMLLLILLAALALTSGCVCCSLGKSESTTTVKEATTQLTCNPPYTTHGKDCCLDKNNNKICDSEETTTSETITSTKATTTTVGEPSGGLSYGTIATTTTTKATTTTVGPLNGTTTIPAASCSDSIKNQDEVIVDCGGVCQNECDVLNLTMNGKAMNFEDYTFRLRDSKLKTEGIEYTMEITTPDGYKDEREMKVGEGSWIDKVKFKIEDGTEAKLIVIARVDLELIAKTPVNATIKTIGGQSCVQLGGGICTRSYNGYEISMINRIDGGGVRMGIKKPDGIKLEGVAYENGTRYVTVGDEGIVIGVLDYMIPGGYANIYLKDR